jgi:hypothetical protein
MPETVVPGLERRLKAQLLGEVQFDALPGARHRRPHYQIMPIGVAPSSTKEVEATLALARGGVSVTARGGGTAVGHRQRDAHRRNISTTCSS